MFYFPFFDNPCCVLSIACDLNDLKITKIENSWTAATSNTNFLSLVNFYCFNLDPVIWDDFLKLCKPHTAEKCYIITRWLGEVTKFTCVS